MTTVITARHFEVSDSLKDRIHKAAAKLERFDDRIVDCHVVMDVQRHRNLVEVLLNAHGHTLRGKGESDNMYSAIDTAFEKSERQLKRLDSKLNDHRANKEGFVASLIEETEESEELEEKEAQSEASLTAEDTGVKPEA
ncbi:MAG: ribosome-associated translation inhibitor RaiA [Candidatus Latescibacteria bacterium]|nr:ribosome-associated translation inhibitor RaiA [Candidatus Latescibacterota bacterium]MCK5525685.1 ribosome-associated translation inhibitor RaiA [Candidatus Latescibacterota bacterium]